MQFLMIMKSTPDSEAGKGLDPQVAAAITERAEQAKRKGNLLASGALLPSSAGARIQATNGKISITDGPFSETKELVGGFALMEANTREEAIEGAKAFMQLYVDALGPNYAGQMEVRPLMAPAFISTGREAEQATSAK